MKRIKKVFCAKKVDEKVFAFISASASMLTELQVEHPEVVCLCSNLWQLYFEQGGHDRAMSPEVRSFESNIVKKTIN